MDSFSSGGARADLAAKLDGARRVIERHFRAAGEVLMRSMEGIDALVASLEKLVEALDAKAVTSTTGDIRSAAQALLDMAADHQARQRTIENLSIHRDGLGRSVADIRASLAYMRAFTVNIKIVSSGIAEASSTFGSFAQEISDCIESGREELRLTEDEVFALQESLSDALQQGGKLTARIGTLIPVLPDELNESAGRMGEHYNKVSSVAEDVAGIARQIKTHVMRVLQALQVGDSTRQRIENVHKCLLRVDAIPSYSEEDQRLKALGYALLEKHLVSTLGDFHSEVAAVETAMADMGTHSRDLLKLRDMAYGGGDGFLNDLATRIEQALVLVKEIESADDSALQMGRETASAAAQLGKRIAVIQSLKNDVQYMALNTTIKCAQIGVAARPLSVVAVELRDHGRHLESHAASGLAELDELTSAAGELANEKAEKISASHALEVAVKLIREARNRTESEVASLVKNGEAVLAVLDSSSEKLAFRGEIGDTLEMVAENLAAQAASAEHTADGIEERFEAMLAEFEPFYVMAQERDIHDAFALSLSLRTARARQAA